MRHLLRSAMFGGLFLVPASAMAFVWPFAQPSLPEEAARMIAMQNGVAMIIDVDGTIDADWQIEGTDAWGHEVELTIDGRTGEVERAELDAE